MIHSKMFDIQHLSILCDVSTSFPHSSLKQSGTMPKRRAGYISLLSVASGMRPFTKGCSVSPLSCIKSPCARSGSEGWKWNSVHFHIGMWRISFVPHWISMSSHSERYSKTAPRGSPTNVSLGVADFGPRKLFKGFSVTPE